MSKIGEFQFSPILLLAGNDEGPCTWSLLRRVAVPPQALFWEPRGGTPKALLRFAVLIDVAWHCSCTSLVVEMAFVIFPVVLLEANFDSDTSLPPSSRPTTEERLEQHLQSTTSPGPSSLRKQCQLPSLPVVAIPAGLPELPSACPSHPGHRHPPFHAKPDHLDTHHDCQPDHRHVLQECQIHTGTTLDLHDHAVHEVVSPTFLPDLAILEHRLDLLVLFHAAKPDHLQVLRRVELDHLQVLDLRDVELHHHLLFGLALAPGDSSPDLPSSLSLYSFFSFFLRYPNPVTISPQRTPPRVKNLHLLIAVQVLVVNCGNGGNGGNGLILTWSFSGVSIGGGPAGTLVPPGVHFTPLPVPHPLGVAGVSSAATSTHDVAVELCDVISLRRSLSTSSCDWWFCSTSSCTICLSNASSKPSRGSTGIGPIVFFPSTMGFLSPPCDLLGSAILVEELDQLTGNTGVLNLTVPGLRALPPPWTGIGEGSSPTPSKLLRSCSGLNVGNGKSLGLACCRSTSALILSLQKGFPGGKDLPRFISIASWVTTGSLGS